MRKGTAVSICLLVGHYVICILACAALAAHTATTRGIGIRAGVAASRLLAGRLLLTLLLVAVFHRGGVEEMKWISYREEVLRLPMVFLVVAFFLVVLRADVFLALIRDGDFFVVLFRPRVLRVLRVAIIWMERSKEECALSL
jgi:hypothetical protein